MRSSGLPCRKRGRRGVVLLDIILAMAVLALGALVLMPAPRHAVGTAELRAEAVRIAASFRQARATAVRTRQSVDVFVDPGSRRVEMRGRSALTIREEVGMRWVTSDQCPASGGIRALRYLADGRSCGGVLTLSAGAGQVQLRVDWLTGRVEMAFP